MSTFKKAILRAIFFCWIVSLAVTLPPKIQANENFDITLKSTYTVDAVGVTKVAHNFIVTNKQPTIFLTQYALKTSYPDLQNVIVRYDDQVLIPNIVKDNSGTSIAIDFPDEVVGQGKARKFIIEYSNTNLATIGGKVLELHIPELPEASNYTQHTTELYVPEQYGYPPRIDPDPDKTNTKDNYFVLGYDDLKGKPITAIFGDKQIYAATLRYQLENSTSGTTLAQIALPPDTSFQKISIQDIDPAPEDIKTDADGNWIATYKLGPASATNVYVNATILVTLTPNLSVPVLRPSAQSLQADTYWEVQDPLIQDLVRKYRTPKEMYDYVVKTLTYSTGDLSEGSSRQGAVEAFENPEQAVCQEFSDTFITLARAAAIPARRNTGYGYAENDDLRPSSFEGDILHAWPEYWNEEKELWIPIDPTWGDTTGGIDYFSNFDLNHIVFAINGNSSTTPYPAGSYKSTGNEAAKDVTISFAETFPAATPNLSVALIPKRVFGIPLPGLVTAIITNQTEQAWYNISLEFESRDPSVTLQKNKTIKIPSILPYEQRKYTLTVYQDGLQLPKQVTIQPRISTETNEVYEHKTLEATSGPAFISYVTDQTIIIAMAGSAVVLTLIAGSVLVLRQRR